MANKYSNKYPEIVVDKQSNYYNATGTVHKLTVEEYQDLMHHTHKISDILDGDGAQISTGEVSKEEFTELKSIVNQLKDTVQALQNSIEESANIHNNLTQRIQNLEKDSLSNGLMIDYDIDEPGIQNHAGETIHP